MDILFPGAPSVEAPQSGAEPMTQALFDEIRADASVVCADYRLKIATAQAEIAEFQAEIANQDLRVNTAARQLMRQGA
jgi:hypothetical protein